LPLWIDAAVQILPQPSGGRPIMWIFAEEEAAFFARALFKGADQGRESIIVGYVPWGR